jgi:hypothetical protein
MTGPAAGGPGGGRISVRPRHEAQSEPEPGLPIGAWALADAAPGITLPAITCTLFLVEPATVVLAGHHRLVAVTGDLREVVLLRLAQRRVLHVGFLEEVGVGRPGHEGGDGDPRVGQLDAERLGELALEVGLDEGPVHSDAGVDDERVDRHAPRLHPGDQLLDALVGGEVGAHGRDVVVAAAQADGSTVDVGVLGGDHQVEVVVGQLVGQRQADAARGTGHHRQRMGRRGRHGSSVRRGHAPLPEVTRRHARPGRARSATA